MISAYTLVNDRIISIKPQSTRREKDALIWFRCINPDNEEVKLLCGLTKIPKDEIDEFLTEDERPRIDIEKTFQLIFESPYKNETIETVPVSIFLDRNHILTIEKVNLYALDHLEEQAKKSSVKFLFRRNPGAFMHHILDCINDDFLYHINLIGQNVKIFKETTVYNMKQKAQRTYSTSVTLSHFHQALIANLEAVNALRKSHFRQFSRKNMEAYSELYHDILQLLDTERVQRETVSNLFNLQSIISSNRLNLFIKKLTSIAIIVMIPTLISSIYGMNLALPFENDPNAFYYITGFMFGISLLFLSIFKYLDWL